MLNVYMRLLMLVWVVVVKLVGITYICPPDHIVGTKVTRMWAQHLVVLCFALLLDKTILAARILGD